MGRFLNEAWVSTVAVVLIALAAPIPHARAAQPLISCGDLARLALPKAQITSADLVPAVTYRLPAVKMAGMFSAPGMNIAGRATIGPNPAFCRVAATLRPSADSDIKIEVWLPQEQWNGKLLTAGNFASAGSLMYAAMLTGLQEGYATASTDTGHGADNTDFALGHPEKFIDYAYRADHELTLDAKAVIKAFYGTAPVHSYWVGCSLGGLEGLIEAKRFPNDYDGIVAGAPPNPLARFNALQLWADYLISQDPARLISKQKYAMVHEAVLKSCASTVGLKQGFVDEPNKCGFDPATLQCKAEDNPTCLTGPQVFLLQQTYAGPTNPRTHQLIFPGPARGSELDLSMFASGGESSPALELYRYAVFQDPNWTFKGMDWDKDVTTAISKIEPLMHVDTDLQPFFNHGGKLLMYIGWNDYHNPEQLIEYYKAVAHRAGKQANSLRLFTIPGMAHCMGGTGCDTFDKLDTIDAWVAHAKEPQRIVSSKVTDGKVVRTSALCAYPEVARYKGTGDINDAASFACSQ